MKEINEILAEAAHEMNRILCESVGDDSQVHWVDAPKWMKESVLEDVKDILAAYGPRDLHQNWIKRKTDSGWVHGDTVDESKLTHPCIVDYDELPLQQRQKVMLFIRSVLAMRDTLEGSPLFMNYHCQNEHRSVLKIWRGVDGDTCRCCKKECICDPCCYCYLEST